MKALFDETMSSSEAMRVFFDYAAAHKGEDMEDVKKAYREVSEKIVLREMKENQGVLTSHHFSN